MITLNLLPDVKIEYLRTKRLQVKVMTIASITTMVAVALVVVAAIGVYGGQALQKKLLEDEIAKRTQELKSLPEINEYLTVQNQLIHLGDLHENKNDFSRLLTFLPALNPSRPHNVTLTNIEMEVEDENYLLLQGEVSDYTGLNTFRDTLRNATFTYEGNDEPQPLFEEVVVESSSLEQSRNGGSVVTFRIETLFNLDAFLFQNKVVKVKVPNINTTQSVQAAPDVFGEGSTDNGGEQ